MAWTTSLVCLAVATACSSSSTLGPPGSTARLRGRISDKPWEHMMTNVPGKRPEYFDYAAGKQVVVYWVNEPSCRGEIEITGTVIEASGPAKRAKSDPPGVFTELSLDVATARCVD
jgi:hypothetical protein